MHRTHWIAVPTFSVALFFSTGALAADIQAGSSDYKAAVAALQPGDTLHLAAGLYSDLLVIKDLQGTASEPIVIQGPSSGEPAVFVADPGPCCNTVEIRNSAFTGISGSIDDERDNLVDTVANAAQYVKAPSPREEDGAVSFWRLTPQP